MKRSCIKCAILSGAYHHVYLYWFYIALYYHIYLIYDMNEHWTVTVDLTCVRAFCTAFSENFDRIAFSLQPAFLRRADSSVRPKPIFPSRECARWQFLLRVLNFQYFASRRNFGFRNFAELKFAWNRRSPDEPLSPVWQLRSLISKALRFQSYLQLRIYRYLSILGKSRSKLILKYVEAAVIYCTRGPANVIAFDPRWRWP